MKCRNKFAEAFLKLNPVEHANPATPAQGENAEPASEAIEDLKNCIETLKTELTTVRNDLSKINNQQTPVDNVDKVTNDSNKEGGAENACNTDL